MAAQGLGERLGDFCEDGQPIENALRHLRQSYSERSLPVR